MRLIVKEWMYDNTDPKYADTISRDNARKFLMW